MENEALELIDHFLCSWCACRLSSGNEKLGACRAYDVLQLILEPRLYSFAKQYYKKSPLSKKLFFINFAIL